jgi:hypothetical protein
MDMKREEQSNATPSFTPLVVQRPVARQRLSREGICFIAKAVVLQEKSAGKVAFFFSNAP